MKNFLFLVLLFIPFISTKEVETPTEQFECIATYLRDKKLLEKNFKFFVQDQQLDCEIFIEQAKEEMLNSTISAMIGDDSSEDDEDIKKFKEMYLTSPKCFYEQLSDLRYVEDVMKTFIYSHAKKLSKSQRKKYLANVESDSASKIIIASSICFPDSFFGDIFDAIFKNSTDEEENDLDAKQTDYCIRKYVIDNNLIDTATYNVNVNPDNLENVSEIDCTEYVEDAFQELKEEFSGSFFSKGEQPKSQIRCINRSLRKSKAYDFIAKMSVLSELPLNREVIKSERSNFVHFMSDLYGDLIKCF